VYLLDEPSIGLHMADVERLVLVLHRLVNAGHSVVLIEHNLDRVAAGTPAQVARVTRRSHTGRALAELFATRAPA